MLDTSNMASRPVQISLDQDLLRRIAAEPEARRHGRSAFIRSALRLYLKAKERHDIDRAIRRAYSGKADELLEEAEALFEVQEWPER
jgi:metal-responsive CopG/Arc/MetJ family transcriptional regulator